VKLFVRLSFTSMLCAVAGFAMAGGSNGGGIPVIVPVGASAPEIGDGVISAALAMMVLLGFVLFPRLKRLLQSKLD
jgi:hypothetical protein